MSFVGNCGTFTRGYRAMILDVEFLYHLLYLLICAMGLFVHEFFYSLLVSSGCPEVLHTENKETGPCPPCHPRPCLVMVTSVPGLSGSCRPPPPVHSIGGAGQEASQAAIRCPGGARSRSVYCSRQTRRSRRCVPVCVLISWAQPALTRESVFETVAFLQSPWTPFPSENMEWQ